MSKKNETLTVKRHKPRNPLVAGMMLRRSGLHEKTHKAHRKGDKQKLRKELLSFWVILFKNNVRQRNNPLFSQPHC